MSDPNPPSPLDDEAFFELVRTRRSVRHYDARPIDPALVRALCERARWAPSNWNGQPWRLVVIDDPDTLKRVCDALDERATELARTATADVRVLRFVEHCRRYFDVLHRCPVMILACYKPAGRLIEEAIAEHWGSSVEPWNPNLLSLGMAVQNLLLAAHANGLGACFHSGPVAFLRPCIHTVLDLPPRLELAGVVTLGWPSPELPPRVVERKPLDHIVRYVVRGDP